MAGEDPVAWLERWGRRVRRLHLKDLALGVDPPWVDLGDGLVDGPAIVAACRRHAVPWCLVEHDAPADPWSTVRRSAATRRIAAAAVGPGPPAEAPAQRAGSPSTVR
jgi:sugar phosphate isomerase/epimerase